MPLNRFDDDDGDDEDPEYNPAFDTEYDEEDDEENPDEYIEVIDEYGNVDVLYLPDFIPNQQEEEFQAAVTASMEEADANQDDQGQALEEEENGEEEENREEEENEAEKDETGRTELDSPNCTICYDPWTSDGPHRVCCIPCGHVYGRSCIEKWLRCKKSAGKCPQCNKKYKPKEIINLYAPTIIVSNNDLEKEVCTLRENNEMLRLENSRLHEEVKKFKMHTLNMENYGRQKILCLEPASAGGTQRRLCAYPDGRASSSAQALFDHRFSSHSLGRDEYPNWKFLINKEFRLDGARVMGIDASSQILLISGKAPGANEHVLHKISLVSPHCEMDRIHLPSNTGVVKDLCVLPNGHVLLASLGKMLSLLSVSSKNCILKYDLPSPAWSCSGDFHNSNYIYAGLQNGTLLMFDIRQTSNYLCAIDGLSRHPIHTTHSTLQLDTTRQVLTASSSGVCVWNVNNTNERPYVVPDLDNYGICISLAYDHSTNAIVASFRPRVECSNDISYTQASLSSQADSRSGKLGSHIYMKKNGTLFEKYSVGGGYVSEVRMSKSAIISSRDRRPLFAYGDELSRGVCLSNLTNFQVHSNLKPHPHPILDLKYSRASSPGFLGCISEDTCQVFSCL